MEGVFTLPLPEGLSVPVRSEERRSPYRPGYDSAPARSPGAEEAGYEKHIGWHSFRHGMSNLLRDCKVDVKVAQELPRHANSRIPLDIYQQIVTDERRAAQELAFGRMWSAPVLPACQAIEPFRTLGEFRKKRSSS